MTAKSWSKFGLGARIFAAMVRRMVRRPFDNGRDPS
jgi:hypothetical protein